MAEYWFMPHGLVGNLRTIFKNDRVEVGQHSFWRGTLMGRRIALQGDPSVTRYDVFEDAGDRILYWGTFRGNAYEHGDNAFTQASNSNSFDAPFTWMRAQMSVGDELKEPVTDNNYDHQLRKAKDTQTHIFRLKVDAHYENYEDPESALPWNDVLKVTFWSRGTEQEPDPKSRETYYLAKGMGTVRFETSNDDPSGVLRQYALSFESQAPSSPAIPWFDPFKNRSFVPNGFFEDRVSTPASEGPVSTHLQSWSGSSDDVVITRAFSNPVAGPWAIRLKVGARGGPDAAETTGWVPVEGGATYKLSGYVWRSSSADRVYLDFHDGEGQGGRFPDAEAMATRVGVWEYVEATATVDAATTGIKVRCVRDGANAGDGLCDGLTLQRN